MCNARTNARWKGKIIIKLNRAISLLEECMVKVMSKIENLEERKGAIEDRASSHNRDMTEKEQMRYYDLEEQIDALQCEMDDIGTALEMLREYEI